MSGLERRGGSRLTRSQREKRAYQLTVAGGGLALVTVAGTVLAILGILGGTIPLLAAVLAIVCFVLFRRTVSG